MALKRVFYFPSEISQARPPSSALFSKLSSKLLHNILKELLTTFSSPKFQSPLDSPPQTWSGCHRNTPLGWYQLVLVRVSILVQTSWGRRKLGRRWFIQFTLPHCYSSTKNVRTGTQEGQEAGTDAEAMEGCYLLTCFPAFLSLLSYRTQEMVASPEMVPPTVGPTSPDH